MPHDLHHQNACQASPQAGSTLTSAAVTGNSEKEENEKVKRYCLLRFGKNLSKNQPLKVKITYKLSFDVKNNKK